MRAGFRGILGDPSWGESDTLRWVSTSTEPLFDFFMLDGYAEFVDSGIAQVMMSSLQIMMTGKPLDDYNETVAMNLLHKGAFMFFLMNLGTAQEDLTVSAKREAKFMLDAFDQVKPMKGVKQISWALDKIKRYVADEDEDAARNLYEKVVKVYGNAAEFRRLKSEFENALN